MTAATVGMLNLILGTIYTCYGIMTIVDLKRGWGHRGYSHFGFAWLAMAFTCGPHHLDHGAHIFLTNRHGGPLDVLAVVMGVPVGVTWFLLRVEAMMGGKGDRFINGTPLWLQISPTIGAVYVAALITAMTGLSTEFHNLDWRMSLNVALLFLYGAIGHVLLSTQFRNHAVTGGWSLSGLSLGAVMYTCGLMHAVYTFYAATGRYEVDVHGLTIDTASVPAALYFLWVVWALHRGALNDWNGQPAAKVRTMPTGVAA